MLTEKDITRVTVETIVEAVRGYVKRRKPPKFNILDLLCPKERAIASPVHGLSTSLGTTLWEVLAKELAERNGFEVKEVDELKLRPIGGIARPILEKQSEILASRARQRGEYSASKARQSIWDSCRLSPTPSDGWKAPGKGETGTGVDLWFTRDDKHYLFDTKTVQPNKSGGKKFLMQILDWYIHFFAKFPNLSHDQLEAKIVFPYNPYESTSYWSGIGDKLLPLVKKEEAWSSEEFWPFLTECDSAYESILDAFKEIKEKKLVARELQQLFRSSS